MSTIPSLVYFSSDKRDKSIIKKLLSARHQSSIAHVQHLRMCVSNASTSLHDEVMSAMFPMFPVPANVASVQRKKES